MKMSTTVVSIPPHRLFNWLQNMNRSLVIDMRSEEHYNRSHIKQSVHVLDDDTQQQRIKHIIRHVVFVPGDCSDMEYQSSCQLADALVVKLQSQDTNNCFEFYRLDCTYESFKSSYTDCPLMFYDSSDPNMSRRCYPNEIIPGRLFLGNARQSSDMAVLRDLNITRILDASGQEVSRSAAEKSQIEYYHVNIDDFPTTDIAAHFKDTNRFIASALEAPSAKVLVHCQAGVSRGCTFVVAYLMYSRISVSLQEAMHTVLAERPWVCPNVSFRQQLRDYEATLHPLSSPSFESDEALMKMIHSYFDWNSESIFTSVFDDTPVVAGREELVLEKAIAKYEEEQAAMVITAPVKPKKTFLKRGQGYTSARANVRK